MDRGIRSQLRSTTIFFGVFPVRSGDTSEGIVTVCQSIEYSVSFGFIPHTSATLPVRGERTIDGFSRNPDVTASSILGRKYEFVGPISIGIGENGFVPDIISPKNKRYASRKFMVTPAISTATRWIQLRLIKFPSLNASGLVISSQAILTNPQIGSALKVKSVPCLSVYTFLTLGGSQNPNSSTFIRVSRAIEKCPNSWIITTTKNTIQVRRIQRILFIILNFIYERERK